MNFREFFYRTTETLQPYPYQVRLGEALWPTTLIMPTGFGKTAAVLSAWLWKLARNDPETPRRLVYCLPMRTLVEQTEETARKWIESALQHLPLEVVRMEVLMGGRGMGKRGIPDWIMKPDEPTLLIGTQDMLVSAALMRSYGANRYRWPVDFALLHNDAMWVFDEVQLSGATLATSAQLEAFREAFGAARQCRTLWMSATLDPAWLSTVDYRPVEAWRPHDLLQEDIARDDANKLWLARKRLVKLDLSTGDLSKKAVAAYAAALATHVWQHVKPNSNTIVFLNTVARAQAVFDAILKHGGPVECRLIHSRFRAAERQALVRGLKEAPDLGRIVVATQALEAGVDISSAVLFTEVASWSSLVQRFGRCNRYGEHPDGADLFWIDLPDTAAAPYEEGDLAEARAKLAGLDGGGPADLASLPPSAPARGHVIRKRDLIDLFDTEPDLSGFDVDVSLYVRDAEDTDVRLFWRPVGQGQKIPDEDVSAPSRDELCPAPIGGAKDLLKRSEGRAWRWDTLAKRWTVVGKDDVYPGLTIWIDSEVGGYDRRLGFEPSSKVFVDSLESDGEPPPGVPGDPDSLTRKVRVSLSKHTDHVCREMQKLVSALDVGEDEGRLLIEAATWHDWGKAHLAFVALTRDALGDGVSPPLAKWPRAPKGQKLPEGARRYFRHELASSLGYLAHREWKEEASLVAYLIAAHHGKVRMRLRALPSERPPKDDRLFARGVHDGDLLPSTRLGDLDVPETFLDLDIMQLGDSERCGPSWSARTQRLLKQHGPFKLAWLEALLRIADWRASAAEDELTDDDV